MRKILIYSCVIYFYFIVQLLNVTSFNLSPHPNYIFKEPKLNNFQKKIISSYFGYSLNLRKNSLMVGAPRAQSTLNLHVYFKQPGLIFKCHIVNNSCEPYFMDRSSQEQKKDYNSLNFVNKDNQWLGAVMDGKNSFVVCAPNILTKFQKEYYFHGICYRTSNTESSQPHGIQTLTSLRDPKMQYDEKNDQYVYGFGQEGFSLHVTDLEELIMGAPGAYDWKGTVLRYKPKNKHNMKKIPITMDYDLDVLNNNNFNMETASYFGFAVTSAYFSNKKKLYIASAPRGNDLKGEVYIFDFISDTGSYWKKANQHNSKMHIYKIFVGKQMGEYFGYEILADDFNGDGLIDVAISAPLHCLEKSSYDNGKVYVFLNLDNVHFIEKNSLVSDTLINGRFGTSLGKIGDINLDGYYDIAVGAPFEENGVVYIFLGSQNGIVTKPSQRIVSPSSSPFGMFGMAISNGLDIDENHYNDIAIGAPNSEVAYIYKSYPVVSISASIQSTVREIKINDTEFNIKYCWNYFSIVQTKFDIELKMTIKLDSQFHRVKFLDNKIDEKQFFVKASREYSCRIEKILVNSSVPKIFEHIKLEFFFDLKSPTLPEDSDFCTNCVLLNPNIPKYVENIVIVSSGCANNVCPSDLSINSSLINVKQPYLVGLSKTISIKYVVRNSGEIAYLTKVNVTIPKPLSFYNIPQNCKVIVFNLICELTKTQMKNGEMEDLLINIDTTKLYGNKLRITAETYSLSDEQNLKDNTIENIIVLQELSAIEIKGMSSLSSELKEIHQVTHYFKVINAGPSNIMQANFSFYLPLIYTNFQTKIEYPLIEFDSVKAKSFYNKNKLEIIWSPIERKEAENKNSTGENSLSNNQYDENYKNIPFNRSIFFDCVNNIDHYCLKGTVQVYDFLTGNLPVYVNVTFSIDTQKLDILFTETLNIFVLTTLSQLIKQNDQGNTMEITKFNPYTVFEQVIEISTPVGIYISSSIGGLLILILISFGLRKVGFFRRKNIEQFEKEEEQRQNHQVCFQLYSQCDNFYEQTEYDYEEINPYNVNTIENIYSAPFENSSSTENDYEEISPYNVNLSKEMVIYTIPNEPDSYENNYETIPIKINPMELYSQPTKKDFR